MFATAKYIAIMLSTDFESLRRRHDIQHNDNQHNDTA